MGFCKSKDSTHHSQPQRNMEEADDSGDRSMSPPPPNIAEPRTSNGNPDINDTIMDNRDKHLTVFTELCENDTQSPTLLPGTLKLLITWEILMIMG